MTWMIQSEWFPFFLEMNTKSYEGGTPQGSPK